MERYLLPKKRQRVDDPTNTAAVNEDSGDRDGEAADLASAEPQPQEGTTHTQGEKLLPGPKDLSQLPDSGPTCPDLKRYPATEYSGQSRSFNRNWRDHHSWLEYSTTLDAAFCFACRHFSPVHFSKTEKSFTHDGFRNWKKATTSLKSHDMSAQQDTSFLCKLGQTEFKMQKTTGSRILHALDASHAKTVKENRHYIRAVIDALLYTDCQNVAQRSQGRH
ncbi:Zinc finger MYM-type protein 1 [Chionoecetes opilio]|uniref:Zinc finger MYM-type protein 1 n=1 Tax=Chionoecetes opilio TaxID=41210 RepID=A0A8J5CPB4_CHIOP|nr:Zinc finger MYM-type protein 1 [Chionoecetes opilio]